MQNIESRIQNRGGAARRRAAFVSFCILNSAFCILSSCKSSSAPTTQPATKPASITERQDAAMRDPFGYSPWKKDEKSRISGGTTGEYDKDGMKRDMKSVFGP
jgi:hypothetical protein